MAKTNRLNLTDEELLGYSIEDIECKQCNGALCGAKVARIYNGAMLIVCSNCEAGSRVLWGDKKENS